MKHINPAEIVALNLSVCAPTYSKGWGAVQVREPLTP